jgi:hypothetical protein
MSEVGRLDDGLIIDKLRHGAQSINEQLLDIWLELEQESRWL